MDPQFRLPDWEINMTAYLSGVITSLEQGGLARLKMPEGFPDTQITVSTVHLRRVPGFGSSPDPDWRVGQEVAITGVVSNITTDDSGKTLVVKFDGLPQPVVVTAFQAWQCLSKTPPGVLFQGF